MVLIDDSNGRPAPLGASFAGLWPTAAKVGLHVGRLCIWTVVQTVSDLMAPKHFSNEYYCCTC